MYEPEIVICKTATFNDQYTTREKQEESCIRLPYASQSWGQLYEIDHHIRRRFGVAPLAFFDDGCGGNKAIGAVQFDDTRRRQCTW